jgi:hypothetical protein
MLELLSIIHHLDKFRHYLVGRKFKLRCDHKSLQYLQTFKKPTGILARWILKIQVFDYEFEHLKGKENTPCDYLSRFPEDNPLENEINEVNAINSKKAPKSKKLKTNIANKSKNERGPLSLINIKESQNTDETCTALIKYFLYDKELPDHLKTLKKEIDNYYYDLDGKNIM